MLSLVLIPHVGEASFHKANIAEIMTSYAGDANVQFVEIVMNSAGENFVAGTTLSAFDSSGGFTAAVLTVPGDVQSGAGRRWLMATAAFEAASGLSADFLFSPALPISGGMICWGKPNDLMNPDDYVDCVAYGDYTGPSNTHTGVPTYRTPEGHSLRRTSDINDSLSDFECGDPADPENNAFATTTMSATQTCSVCGNGVTEPGEQCDASDDAACPGACIQPGALDECLCALPTTTTTTTTTSTTLPSNGVCGDANGDSVVSATDALLALKAAVNSATCDACLCDVNQLGGVQATDALIVLKFVVGQAVGLNCPPCP